MSFTDRIVEHPGRYMLTDVSTNEVLGTFDLVRAEGTVTEEGTPLTAANLNTEVLGIARSELSEAFIIKEYTYAYTNFEAGTALSITGTMFHAGSPTGYTPIGVRRATSGHVFGVITAIIGSNTGGNPMLNLKNTHTAAISGTATITVVYVRTRYIKTS